MRTFAAVFNLDESVAFERPREQIDFAICSQQKFVVRGVFLSRNVDGKIGCGPIETAVNVATEEQQLCVALLSTTFQNFRF